MKRTKAFFLSFIFPLSLSLNSPAFAHSGGGHLDKGAPQDVWISIGTDVLKDLEKSSLHTLLPLDEREGVALVQVNSQDLQKISELIHEKFNRCGGFFLHESFEKAQADLEAAQESELVSKSLFTPYVIDQFDKTRSLINEVEPAQLVLTIERLSSFHTRYYNSQTGVQASEFILNRWKELSQGRSDITVEYFSHRDWPQKSVVATIQGSESPEEVVILGGHLDSIVGSYGGGSKAPGADDNASGISVLTETLRVLVQASYQPKRTVKLMAYAAEEVGLLGSAEIAKSFKSNGINVVGVAQFDMTNFKGSSQYDIGLVSDYTNAAQNEFLAKLIDQYVKVPWTYTRCGYACSDHASWTKNGYPASIPFESTMDERNRQIHSSRDTLTNSGGNALHAAKFARLAVAYMVELAK